MGCDISTESRWRRKSRRRFSLRSRATCRRGQIWVYPFLAPELPHYAGEVGASDADAAAKDKTQKAATEAVGETLAAFHKFFLDGKTFVGGDHVSIADLRLACSLEFLNAIDYDFPAWTKTYLSAVETSLGDAYGEPAGDIERYIAYVKGQKN